MATIGSPVRKSSHTPTTGIASTANIARNEVYLWFAVSTETASASFPIRLLPSRPIQRNQRIEAVKTITVRSLMTG